jgi:prepilin-type N-terminal cleavage/methylation domain-containing protein/prepilin-type processing-associated H-X9-DG protein
VKTINPDRGFTLTELLVVMAIIVILAALLLPGLSSAKGNAKRATCLNNLKQINVAVLLYAGDNHELLPSVANTGDNKRGSNSFQVYYKPLVMTYAGLRGAPSPLDKVFDCPADTFYYGEVDFTYHSGSFFSSTNDYTSYGFNGQGGAPTPPYTIPDQTNLPGLFGWKITAIREPGKTVLVTEAAAVWPWSWHEFHPVPALQRGIDNSKNMVSFADGHVNYIQMYFDADFFNLACCRYDPPASYDYKWSGY